MQWIEVNYLFSPHSRYSYFHTRGRTSAPLRQLSLNSMIFLVNLSKRWKTIAVISCKKCGKFRGEFWKEMRLKAVNYFFSPHSPHFLQKFTAIVFQSSLKFTRNSVGFSENWRSGIRSWMHAGGESFKPVYINFFFVWIPRTRQKFTEFAAFLTLICRKSWYGKFL